MNRIKLSSVSAALAGVLLLALAACNLEPPQTSGEAVPACSTAGTWLTPGTTDTLAPETVMAGLAANRVVLLGESHDNADHHAWQAQVLAALHGRRPDVVVAFEMFPRRVQPALDKWVAGELSQNQFLKNSEWDKVWGFGADMYMPLFQFARLNNAPMVAANVDRALVRRVGKEGWVAIPESDRLGIGTPAAPPTAYENSLARVFRAKLQAGAKKAHSADNSDAKDIPLGEVISDPGFERFVAAQQTWDRAMAEAIFDAAKRHPDALVVGIVGRGHAEYGHGIPHQLKDLGLDDVAVALPVPSRLCAELPAGIADVAFVTPNPTKQARAHGPTKPKLGVYIEAAPGGGIRVSKVAPNSIAEQSGIEADDVIVEAAGESVSKPADLITIIQRHASGTWLPLDVRRGEMHHDIIAKFPPAHQSGK